MRLIIAACFVAASTGIAMIVSDLGVVLRLVGATGSTCALPLPLLLLLPSWASSYPEHLVILGTFPVWQDRLLHPARPLLLLPIQGAAL